MSAFRRGPMAFVLAFMLVAADPLSAQERGLTLVEALARARLNHPAIRAARERIEAAAGDRITAGKRPNPSVVISGENFPIGGTPTGFRLTRDIDWFVTYTQTFETAGKRSLREEIATRNSGLAESDMAAVERQVLNDVRVAYESFLVADARLRLSQENQQRFLQVVQFNQVRVAEGFASEGDLIKSQLEAQRLEYNTRRAELGLDRARIALLRTMGVPSYSEEIRLADQPVFRPVRLNLEEIEKAALLRPEMRGAREQLQRAEAVLKLEQARVRPDVTASLGFKRNGPSNALYGAVVIPLHIFDKNDGAIARAEADVRRARAQLEQVRSGILAEITSAKLAVEAAQRQVETLQRDFLDRADTSTSVANAAYREGATDFIVLLEAQRARLLAQEMFLQAVFDHRLAIHELGGAAGLDQLPLLQPATDKEDR